jgi:hypothetical protein
MMVLLRQKDTSNVACAFVHTVRSFRNDLFAGYNTGEGIERDLLQQFPLAKKAAFIPGMVVWRVVEF